MIIIMIIFFLEAMGCGALKSPNYLILGGRVSGYPLLCVGSELRVGYFFSPMMLYPFVYTWYASTFRNISNLWTLILKYNVSYICGHIGIVIVIRHLIGCEIENAMETLAFASCV